MSMLKLAKPRASNHPWSWSVVWGKIFFMPVLAIELDESLFTSQSILSREWLEKQRLVNGSVTTYQERCSSVLCEAVGETDFVTSSIPVSLEGRRH